MATRFYLPATEASAVNPAFSTSWSSSASMVRRRMRTTKNGSTHATLSITETNDATFNVGYRQYVGDTINTASAITGTVILQLLAREVLATADAFLSIIVRRFSGDGVTDRGTMLALTVGATEFLTTLTNRTVSGALASISGSVGDRLVVEIGVQFQNTITTNSTGVLEFGDRWADDLPANETFIGSGGSPFVEFSADIPFVTPDIASFYFGADSASNLAYPTTPAAPIATTTFTGGTFTAGRLARRDRLTPLTGAKTISVSGGGGAEVYFRGIGHVTDFLAAQTVAAGTWTVQWNCKVSAVGIDFQGFRVHLFVVKPDGTKRSDIGTSAPVDIASISNVNRSVTVAGGAVTIENQDRILCETEGYDLSGGTYTITFNISLTGSFLKPPQTLLLGSAGPAFQGATQFDLDAYDNHLADLFVAQNSPTRTMEIVTKVKNRSVTTARNIAVAIYSNSETAGVDAPGTALLTSGNISVAASFTGEKRVAVDTSALVVGVKYWVVVCYDTLTDLSLFYDATVDVPTRGYSFTATYGTWPTSPAGTYFEQAPDYTYVNFQGVAVVVARIPQKTTSKMGL